MPDEEDCRSEMFVSLDWMGRRLGVSLIHLETIEASSDTQEAAADRHYWVGRGYQLC
jgi:hypothetical protein